MNGELFDEEEIIPWKAEWQNMPEYSHEDLGPKFQLIVSFATLADVEAFSALIGQTILTSETSKVRSLWFPDQEIGRYANKRYIGRP